MSRAAAIASEHRIGQYKILRTLGVGGMGTVYLGEHLLLGRRAAIKTLLASLSSQREIVDRFFNEARAISAISDPGVVQIFDFGYHVDGTAYIVMEFLEGEPLSSRIDRLGTLPLVDALRITRQIGASLAAAHDRGIVHRDLKPSNVYVIRDAEAQGGERTKILDFGIAKLNDDQQDVHHTQRGTVLGTPVYMSPEQCRGAKNVDHRSDIYSVGCALFHMLTGRPPFVCDSVGEFLASHLREEPPAPSTIRPEIPPAVDALVLRCLAKSPDDRFQSTAALQAAAERQLAKISDSGHTVAAAPVATTPLGHGFQSEYDVNAGNRVDTSPPPPRRSIDSHSWFVDSMSVVASSISDHYAVPRRLPIGKWLAFLAALVVGIGAGLLVTDFALSAHEANAAPVSTPIGTASASPELLWLRETRSVLEVAPPEPPPELLTAPVAALPVHVQPVQVQPVRIQRAKVQRPPRPHVMKPPQPRRTHSAPKPTPSEDLYDTR